MGAVLQFNPFTPVCPTNAPANVIITTVNGLSEAYQRAQSDHERARCKAALIACASHLDATLALLDGLPRLTRSAS